MKQLFQRLDTGATEVVDAPVPSVIGPTVLVKNRASLISPGTERMILEFAQSGWIAKARSQPEKVQQVLEKGRAEGFGAAFDAVRSKLRTPIQLGYCAAGVVAETGTGVQGFAAGDRVVCNGPHAEFVRVPHTLVARIPDNVGFEDAAFAPLAAIGLQGIRLAAPTLGETVVVYGLGLIGLLTVQLLRANGCRVIGIDRDQGRLALAENFGAVAIDGTTTPASRVRALTAGEGADAVLLTLASASNEPMHQAAEMSRRRGRIVLVGVTGLHLSRDDFYKKELSFTVSCSYGPGRYDARYEEDAIDYPLPHVRWTAKRNFEAALTLMESGQLDPRSLVTNRCRFDDAGRAYELISNQSAATLAVILEYGVQGTVEPTPEMRTIELAQRPAGTSIGVAGVIGAGNFASRVLIPHLKETGFRLRTIGTGGTSGVEVARQFGFERATTDVSALINDPEIDTVFVLTRHDSHASLVSRALEAGKHVFVEKPLGLTEAELNTVATAAATSGRMLMVGFNRRFAPLAKEVQQAVANRGGPLSIVATINAGHIPTDHWTQNPAIGGGRIVGEACHWIDLARFLVGAPITDAKVVRARNEASELIEDISHMVFSFSEGSTAVVHYLSHGSRSFPKERIECFWDGKTVAIDNWRRLRHFGLPGSRLRLPRRPDKGHRAELSAWRSAIIGDRQSPILLEELLEVSRWAIRVSHLCGGTDTGHTAAKTDGRGNAA